MKWKKERVVAPNGESPRWRGYGYVRVSTEEQLSGVSLAAQEEKIRAWASLKDVDLVEVIRDEGYSGKNLKRPGFERLLELIRGPEAEAVVVYKLDRLTRSTSDLLFLIEKVFKEGNTRFFSISEEIDTESAMGKFFLTVMGAMAQMERELIGERTRMSLQYKKSQGESLGLVPFGYRRVAGRLEPDLEEEAIVGKMRMWKEAGESYRGIARRLQEEGIKPRRPGYGWNAATVRVILLRREGGGGEAE